MITHSRNLSLGASNLALMRLIIVLSFSTVSSGFQIPPHQVTPCLQTTRNGKSKAIFNRNIETYFKDYEKQISLDEAEKKVLSKSSPSSSSTIKPYVEMKHKATNTTIVLLGCLHGSPSSSKDVEEILSKGQTDAVVLELCESRYDILTHYMSQREEEKNESSSNSADVTAAPLNSREDIMRSFFDTKNFGANVATGILTGISALSGSFSTSFQTGLEFITAIDYVNKNSEPKFGFRKKFSFAKQTCHIVLGDRDIDETMTRMGSILPLSFRMLIDFFKQRLNWSETYGIDARVVTNAISGDKDLKQKGLQLDMGSVLLRNKSVIVDLVRLVLPSIILIQFLTILLNEYFSVLHGSKFSIEEGILIDMNVFTDIDWDQMTEYFYTEAVAFLLGFLVTYIGVILPASRVIISERDTCLAKAIDDACIAVVKRDRRRNNKTQERRVVAVLGLIHVNGIAKILTEDSQQ